LDYEEIRVGKLNYSPSKWVVFLNLNKKRNKNERFKIATKAQKHKGTLGVS